MLEDLNSDHAISSSPEPIRFVIFGQGRTGSTLLASLLASHSKIHCDGEVLANAVSDPIEHVARFAAASPKPVHGFNVKIYQLSDTQHVVPAVFLSALARVGTRILFLSRRNLLRHALSNRLALANRYHFRTGDTVALEPVRIDPPALLAALDKRAEHRRSEEAAIAGLVVHRMVYEDDLIDLEAQRRSLKGCFAFLGVPSEPVVTDLIRGVTGPVSSHIVNYREVAEVLKGTPYEHWLEDDRTYE